MHVEHIITVAIIYIRQTCVLASELLAARNRKAREASNLQGGESGTDSQPPCGVCAPNPLKFSEPVLVLWLSTPKSLFIHQPTNPIECQCNI